jgi:hypothetical protein
VNLVTSGYANLPYVLSLFKSILGGLNLKQMFLCVRCFFIFFLLGRLRFFHDDGE